MHVWNKRYILVSCECIKLNSIELVVPVVVSCSMGLAVKAQAGNLNFIDSSGKIIRVRPLSWWFWEKCWEYNNAQEFLFSVLGEWIVFQIIIFYCRILSSFNSNNWRTVNSFLNYGIFRWQWQWRTSHKFSNWYSVINLLTSRIF